MEEASIDRSLVILTGCFCPADVKNAMARERFLVLPVDPVGWSNVRHVKAAGLS